MTIANRATGLLFGAAVIGALVASSGASAASRPAVKDYMARNGFSADDLAALERGEPVTTVLTRKMVGPNDTAEVAVAGVIRVDVPRQVFIESVRDVQGFRSSGHLQIGIIQDPPQASDFEAVTIPADDIEDLEKCKPGDCALKLAGSGLEELHSRIDWKAPDRADQVNRYAREKLLLATESYLKEGIEVFEPLEDKEIKVSLAQQFDELLENTPDLIAFYPELAAYLKDYPHAELGSSRDVLFWTLKDFGLKPTVTLTHAVGYLPEGTEDAVIAWKLIYASHYFNGGLQITTYARDGEASYLVQLDRVRADTLGGTFGGVKQKRMASAMKDDLERWLRETRTNLQAEAKRLAPAERSEVDPD